MEIEKKEDEVEGTQLSWSENYPKNKSCLMVPPTPTTLIQNAVLNVQSDRIKLKTPYYWKLTFAELCDSNLVLQPGSEQDVNDKLLWNLLCSFTFLDNVYKDVLRTNSPSWFPVVMSQRELYWICSWQRFVLSLFVCLLLHLWKVQLSNSYFLFFFAGGRKQSG